MEETKTAEEMHPHAAGKKIGMEFLRKTQIPTTTQQRDTLFEMINKGLTQQQSAYAELQNKFDNLLSVYDLSKKHVELLKKQNEELVEMLQMHVYSLDFDGSEFHKKYGFNHAELFPRTRILLRKYTT